MTLRYYGPADALESSLINRDMEVLLMYGDKTHYHNIKKSCHIHEYAWAKRNFGAGS